jgi:hypothetical protein
MRPSVIAGSDKNFAETACAHIEELLECKQTGRSLDLDTIRWLRKLPDDFHGKLSKKGLVESRKQAKLGEYTQQLIDARKDWASSTRESTSSLECIYSISSTRTPIYV